MNRILKTIAAVLSIWMLISCAQEKGITGGKKDTTPPKIISSNPQNLSTNFDGNTIAMVFDEFVQVKSLPAELIVSPPLNYPVTYKLKGKKVTFEIQDTLIPNSTYNFNFGNSIVDLNEANPLDSNLFVVSTGSDIDSLTIVGEVKDAYTLQPLKGVTVLLFNNADDSAIYKGGPTYIAKTDDKGKYDLRFLHAGNYQIFALTNPSRNYGYYPLDKAGFYAHQINPEEIDSVNFMMFIEEDTLQYVSKSFSRAYFSFVTGFYSDLESPKFSFTPSGDEVDYYMEEIAADSFKFWMSGDVDIDSVQVFVSDQTGYSDTARIDVSSRDDFYKKLKKKKETKSPVKIDLNTKSGVFHYFDTLNILLSRPPVSWQTDRMFFVQNTDTTRVDELIKAGKMKIDFPRKTRGTPKDIRQAKVIYPWEPSTQYAFMFYPGAVKDVINQTNDTLTKTFKTQSFEDYGSFKLTVKTPNYNGPLVLELLNAEGKFLRMYPMVSGDVIYQELAVPGKYKVRLVIDENNNKKWDTGDLFKRKQPETMMYYKDVIEIRANWDVDETWIVDFKQSR